MATTSKSNSPIRGPHGRVRGAAASHRSLLTEVANGSVETPRTETTAARIEQLEQSQRETDHLVRALSHDMKAIFMLLEGSFRQLKESVGTTPESPAKARLATTEAPGGKLDRLNQRFAHVEACLQESNRFLDDLVTLARTGGVEMEPERVELAAIVGEVLFEQRELLAARGVQAEVLDDLPAVWCNPHRAKQIVSNLVRNAVKHGCDANNPRIEIVRRGRQIPPVSTDGSLLEWMAIRDNGAGIPAESREAIFVPGHRLPTAHPDGTGMGLSIVRKIVEFYGGQVFVDPDCRQGTAIVFSLPRPPVGENA